MRTFDYFKVTLFGLASIITFFCLSYVLVQGDAPKTLKEPIKTEVVGQYKNCDIIRLNIPSDAKYHYTLYCEK
jgi:hypothetical protein